MSGSSHSGMRETKIIRGACSVAAKNLLSVKVKYLEVDEHSTRHLGFRLVRVVSPLTRLSEIVGVSDAS